MLTTDILTGMQVVALPTNLNCISLYQIVPQFRQQTKTTMDF